MTLTMPSNNLPRFRRAPGRAGAMRLTDRDRAVLYDLFHFRFLPTSLIVQRRFGSATRGRARLKLLYHHSYVDRHVLPTTGPTMSEAIYSLGPAAVGELVTTHGLEPTDVRRRRKRVEPFFVAHQLAVSRFRIQLAYAGAPAGVGIYDWREERAARIRFESRDPETGELGSDSITPDGIGWLKSRKARFAFCLEVDRGTMTVGRVGAKFRRYQQVAASGAFRRHFGAERFRVLVVAPSIRRLASLKRGAEEVGLSSVWLTTEEALADDPIFTPVWLRAGGAEHFPLLRRDQAFDRASGSGEGSWRLPPGPANGKSTGRETP
jgi:hypothetical protein